MDSNMFGFSALAVVLIMLVAMVLNVKSPVLYKVFTSVVFFGVIVGMGFLLNFVSHAHA